MKFQEKLFESFHTYRHQVAIECGENAITYWELEAKSRQISNRIISSNIEHGSFIGIYIEDSIEFIIVLVGILRARCVFLPLDTSLPRMRILHMLQLTNTRIVFAHAPRWHRLRESSIKIAGTLKLFDVRSSLEKPADLPEPVDDNPQYCREDPIYIYFTSGSSGEPKAIVGKNKSLLHFIEWEIKTFNISSQYRVSQLTTVGFDAYLRDLFVPLCAGGTVCIPSKDTTIQSNRLIQWLERQRIHLIHCVPGIFRLYSQEQLTKKSFKHLEYILMSGETINPHDLKNWYDIIGERIQLVNLYGPTETTMIKTYYFIGKKDIEQGKIPIGKPITGARILLFDKNMNICDQGVIGEIFIRTPYHTFGYYNDPELNRQRFIPNPITGNTDDLLYKTGDLGKELPDGNIEFLGRIDRQVKIRGIRIEPEEIEWVIRKYSDVIERAIVIPVKNQNGGNRLTAFIVSKKGFKKEQIREYLFRQLPEYMIPSHFIPLDKNPLLPNGKTDRKKLELMARKAIKDLEYEEPGNEIEIKLAEIWCEILGLEKIGVNADFFELGGQSVKLLQLASRIKDEFNVEMTAEELFLNLDIKSLAAAVDIRRTKYFIQQYHEKPVILLNKKKAEKVFFFPPQIGLAVFFKDLAIQLQDYAVYSFNFIEDEKSARIRQYADLIQDIQEKGPYILFGYSAGGNLAFAVAKEIEQRGGNISDIVIMDSFQREVTCALETEKKMQRSLNELGKKMEQMGIGFLKEKVIERSKKYAQYHNNTVDHGVVNANIHLITSTNREKRKKRLIITGTGKRERGMKLTTDWEKATRGKYKMYKGFGQHVHMLSPVFLKRNVEIISRILASCPYDTTSQK